MVVKAQREASLGVKWTGDVDGVWNYQTKNFMLNDVETEFVAEDAIEFNDDATTTTVTVGDLMPVSKVTVDNDTKAYTFNGDGGFSARQLLHEGVEHTAFWHIDGVGMDYRRMRTHRLQHSGTERQGGA